MRIGEKIIIERLASRLYKLTKDGEPEQSVVGAAASTIIALTGAVFYDEAMEVSPPKET